MRRRVTLRRISASKTVAMQRQAKSKDFTDTLSFGTPSD
jgi:hypothetical protein